MLENMDFISRVDWNINTRNKFHISTHVCIILYVRYGLSWDKPQNYKTLNFQARKACWVDENVLFQW